MDKLFVVAVDARADGLGGGSRAWGENRPICISAYRRDHFGVIRGVLSFITFGVLRQYIFIR